MVPDIGVAHNREDPGHREDATEDEEINSDSNKNLNGALASIEAAVSRALCFNCYVGWKL